MLSGHMRAVGERSREEGGGSLLRVLFRASPLIYPVIILGKSEDHKGQKGLFKMTPWFLW